jgi:acyl-CoA dehydrogenase
MIPGNLTPDQQTIREAIQRLMQPFSDAYWLERDETATFPHEFRQAVAAGGWLGIAMPEEYGGSGLGVAHAVVMMEAVANSAGAMSAASSVHLNIFGPQAIVKHGTPAQKAEWRRPSGCRRSSPAIWSPVSASPNRMRAWTPPGSPPRLVGTAAIT